MVVLWLYAGGRIAANRAKAVRKRRCGAHKTLRFANLLQARRAAVPIGAKSARLSAVRPLRPAQTLFRQKTAFLFMDKPARKSAERTAFAKGQVGRGGAGTPPSRACAGRNGAFFAAGGAQDPAACLILFTRKVRAGRLILRGPSYAQSKKTPDGRRGGGPAGRKSAGKNAQGRSGRPSGTASAGRTRRTAEIAASGGFSLAQHPPAPRQSAAPQGRASDRKSGRFPPLAACQRRHILQTPARVRLSPPFAKGESQREQSPRRPPRRPEARPPNAHAGEGPRRRASRRAENPRRYLRLAGGPLVLQQLQRTFFVLVFLYFDYAYTQSPAHCAAEKTGRTIFS